MSSERNKLILRDDKRRSLSALQEWEEPLDDFGYPIAEPRELPEVVGETIRSVKAYGISFDRYGASYEYELDGPVLMKMRSGRLFSLFGESLYEIERTRQKGYADYVRHQFGKYMPEEKVQRAFRSLCGHTIIDAYYDERGILEIELDGCIIIESADGCVHEFSEIYLLERLR